MTNENAIVYSADGEFFEESMENVIELILLNEGAKVGETIIIFKGKKREFKFSDFINVSFFDDIASNAYDEVGEFSEGWAEYIRNNGISFSKMINEYAKKEGLEPDFSGVKNIEEIKIKITSEGSYEFI